MTTARRPLLTATAAGALLCALWFVPSAQATEDGHGSPGAPSRVTTSSAPASPAGEARLADSGGMDTTPYVVGGLGFLGLGAAMVTVSLRRSRTL
ncbi:hypothetical protein ACMA1D_29060 [Streptomyces sp. 796.1]|uniref:hypothetical protein n=1 Tax=Streptomyces sp. 796.1 TaxID=3163029 RepID=UPI0039C95331